MYNSKRIITPGNDAVIVLTSRDGTGLARWRIRKNANKDIEISYSLQAMSGASISTKTHDLNTVKRRAYYLLDLSGIAPHLHRAVTCTQSTEYPTRFGKKILAFAGDNNGVDVVRSPNGMTTLNFTSQEDGEADDTAIFAVDLRGVNPEIVRKVQLVTLR